MAEIAAMVLAAGLGTRFGASEATKVAASWRGKPLVRWVAEAALASRAAPVLVVTGHAACVVGTALDSLAVTLVHNPLYASGMASSLHAGLRALPPSTRGVIVLLADMPMVSAAIVDALIERFERDGGDADAVVPLYAGANGNPVLLGRSLLPALATLSGDAGARRLLAEPKCRVLSCPIADAAVVVDVDTPEALADICGRP